MQLHARQQRTPSQARFWVVRPRFAAIILAMAFSCRWRKGAEDSRNIGNMRVVITLCLAAAAAVAQQAPGFDLGALNRRADPCANFYQYACGGWMTGNPLPGDASRWGRFDALQDRNR